MGLERYFSPTYDAARARFRRAAEARGLAIEPHAIDARGPDGEELTLDVARLGREDAEHVVVVSSGIHGVEGFFGSAVQAALLEDHLRDFDRHGRVAVVFLHALNPYGFAWLRRVNEDNVDVNRNFLLADERYEGAPADYVALDPMLNPKRPPGRVSAFPARVALQVARFGVHSFRAAVSFGQYELEQGLFFGGKRPTASVDLVRSNLLRWVAGASRVRHLDFHSGLGKPGELKLITEHEPGSEGAAVLASVYGADKLWRSRAKEESGTEMRGGLGRWAARSIDSIDYDVLTAEVGTVSLLRVLRALHLENRAHHFCDPTSPRARRAKERLRDAFAPPDKKWRDKAVREGLRVVDQTLAAI